MGTPNMALVSDLKLVVDSQMVNGQVYFFSRIEGKITDAERALLPSINLSRGSVRNFRIDQLDRHNGTGATWNGTGVHTAVAQSKYQSRVKADLEAAWPQAKAAIAKARTPVAPPTPTQNSGKSLFFAANGN